MAKNTLLSKTIGLCLMSVIVFLLCTACSDDSSTTQSTISSTTQSTSKFKILAFEFSDSFYQFLDGMDFSDMEQCLKRFRSEEGVELRQKMTSAFEQMLYENTFEKVSVEQKMVRGNFLRSIIHDLETINDIDEETNTLLFPLDKKEIDDVWFYIRFLENDYENMKNNQWHDNELKDIS